MPPVSLFVYGTLMDEARLYALTSRRFPRHPARLEDFERIEPAGGYPYVVPRVGRHVDGFLVRELDADALSALDRYEDEGHLYLRRDVRVTVDGRPVACQVYLPASPRAAPGHARTRDRTSRG